MSQPVAVFFADSHLAPGAWASRSIFGDSYCSFRQIVDFAIKYGVPLIGAGDLLDKQLNHSEPIVFVLRQLDRLYDSGLSFFYIQGQHELESVPWFSGHRASRRLHELSVTIAGMSVYGIDFQPAGQLQAALARIPIGTDVAVLHQVWADFMGSIANPQGNMGDVPVAHIVFTGDYHMLEDKEARGKDGQKIRVISPGSTCLQSIDEPAEKWFYVLMDDRTWKKVRLKTRPVITWDMLHPGDVDHFLQVIGVELDKKAAETEGFPGEIRTPLLRLTYSHRLTGLQVRIRKAIGDRAHIFWKEIPPEKPPEVVARQRIAKETGQRRTITLESELPAYLAARNLTHLQPDAVRLLQTNDVAGELRKMREEALK